MKDLEGRVAVVTGAASGIGLALAQSFGERGMKVVVADVERGPLADAEALLRARGTETLAVPTDVSKSEQVEALAQKACDSFGAVHVVCNNAGVAVSGASWQVPLSDWEWCLGVNLWGVIHGIRAFVPRMIAQGSGHVVNTASIAGVLAVPFVAPYCATKHAVVAISESLHHELALTTAGKVRVSVVCPSWVKTKIADSKRNGPAPTAGARVPSALEQITGTRIRAAVAGGMTPEQVAQRVLSAITADRFWVLTHPERNEAILRRARGAVEGHDPEFDNDLVR